MAQLHKRLERLEQAADKRLSNDDPLTFTASIAPLQSAIRIASDGGARVALDIPESEMPAIVRLVLYRNVVLRVTIEVEESLSNGGPQTHKRTARRPTDMAGR